jgi:hypothetical protein
MPVLWDLDRARDLPEQDRNRFMRLPIWVAQQQTKLIPLWNRWQGKYGSIKWEDAKGDVLQGILEEHSPIVSQITRPALITERPRVTQIEHTERYNFGRMRRHHFESPLIRWINNFRDFRRTQIQFAMKDITRQIGIAHDNFLRWSVVNFAPHIYIVGDTQGEGYVYNNVPSGEVVYGQADPKGPAFWENMISRIGPNGTLNFRQICNIRSVARNVLGIPPWESLPSGAPKENEILKGKWMATGDGAIYESLTMDETILNIKNDKIDLINSEFMGIISGNIAFYQERFPIVFTADGQLPPPEITLSDIPMTDDQKVHSPFTPDGAGKNGQPVMNPAYVKGPAGLMHFEGYQAFEALEVGPPPKEFSGKGISEEKFTKMDWSGVVRVTSNVFERFPDGSIQTNKYGELLQLISDVTMGIITRTPRNYMPVLYRRNIQPFLA